MTRLPKKLGLVKSPKISGIGYGLTEIKPGAKYFIAIQHTAEHNKIESPRQAAHEIEWANNLKAYFNSAGAELEIYRI